MTQLFKLTFNTSGSHPAQSSATYKSSLCFLPSFLIRLDIIMMDGCVPYVILMTALIFAMEKMLK